MGKKATGTDPIKLFFEWYEEARTGDTAAGEQLFGCLNERFSLFVQHRISSRQDAEEVVQDSLMAIAEKYREIEITTSFTAWAYRVLENKLSYYYRTKKTRTRKLAELAQDKPAGGTYSTDPSFRRRLLDCIKKVSRVNIRHARILNLHYQGYSVEYICGKFGVTRNNLYIILSRARSMLKACVETGDLGS